MPDVDVVRTPWVRRLGAGLGWLLLAGLLVLVWPSNLGGCTSVIVVSGHSMEPTLMPGDLVVARCGDPAVGDVVAYHALPDRQGLVIHRITGGDGTTGWVLQGDNNDTEDPFRPLNPAVQGILVLHVPGVGSALAALGNPLVWGSAFLLAAALVLWPRGERDDESDADGEDETRTAGEPEQQEVGV